MRVFLLAASWTVQRETPTRHCFFHTYSTNMLPFTQLYSFISGHLRSAPWCRKLNRVRANICNIFSPPQTLGQSLRNLHRESLAPLHCKLVKYFENSPYTCLNILITPLYKGKNMRNLKCPQFKEPQGGSSLPKKSETERRDSGAAELPKQTEYRYK